MDVLGAAFLTFEGAVDSVHAAKDASHCRGIAAKGIHAGFVRLSRVGAVAAVADAKEVPERQQHQGLKPFRAGQRIPGKQRLPLVIGQQLLAGVRTANYATQTFNQCPIPRQATPWKIKTGSSAKASGDRFT